ncbi:MAG: hypothetical protein LBM73_02445 [Candidatus Nomurabacteria bacterium]|nr:hypothetical protein [Candidatus Nomurabacteria bacterium]
MYDHNAATAAAFGAAIVAALVGLCGVNHDVHSATFQQIDQQTPSSAFVITSVDVDSGRAELRCNSDYNGRAYTAQLFQNVSFDDTGKVVHKAEIDPTKINIDRTLLVKVDGKWLAPKAAATAACGE